MKNLILLILLFTINNISAQNKEKYDEYHSYFSDISDYDQYSEKFLLGNGKKGVIMRQYRSGDGYTLNFIEGLIDGNPKGVAVAIKWHPDGYNSFKFFLPEEFSEDYEQFILAVKGKNNLLFSNTTEVHAEAELFVNYKMNSFLTPINDLIAARFREKFVYEDDDSYYEREYDNLLSCKKGNREECNELASLGRSENNNFYGIWVNKEGNFVPILGRHTPFDDVEIFGFYNRFASHTSGNLNVARHYDYSEDYADVTFIGDINYEGEPVSSHIAKTSDGIYYLLYDFNPSNYIREHLDISKYFNSNVKI